MTEEQRMDRLERVAIMMESGATEAEANLYCNRLPHLFGHVEIQETQEKLF